MKHVVVIGSGIAGLIAAVEAARSHRVTLLTKSTLGESNTHYAQGGIAAVTSTDDSVASHISDTIEAGNGLCWPPAVEVLCSEGPQRIADLVSFGVDFDQSAGEFARGLEAAHSHARILHAGGDATGAGISAALVAAVTARVADVRAHDFVIKLLTDESPNGSRRVVRGVRILTSSGPEDIEADAVILASGGAGQLYRHTTNPAVTTGDGVALAFRAGAVLADVEFYQFHPTALAVPGSFLISEAVRGEGAVLINDSGERFMTTVDARAELAPRDIVARGVFAEIQAGRGAFLDCRTAIGERFAESFPTVYATCQSAGIDPAKDFIPIAPAEHYHMGGVLTSSQGRSTCEGLWAIGEVASTGVHGANRLASNSLLEAIVFAARVADALPAALSPVKVTEKGTAPAIPFDPDLVDMLRQTMTDHVGVIRTKTGLMTAIWTLADIEATGEAPEVTAMARSALFIATAAYARQESRGGHYRSDYPEAKPTLAHRSKFTLDDVRAIITTVLSGT